MELHEHATAVTRLEVRRGQLRELLDHPEQVARLAPAERAAYDQLTDELQADLDMRQDARYGELLAAVEAQFGRALVFKTLFHPESVLEDEVGYPLYASEVAVLLQRFGIEVDERTVNRLVSSGQVPATPVIGTGAQVRNAFFARHVLDIVFLRAILRRRPEVLSAELAMAQGMLDPQVSTYLSALPGVDPRILSRASSKRTGG